MDMIQPPFYRFSPETAIIESKYSKTVGLQLHDGDFLVSGTLLYGNSNLVEKINRVTGEITLLYKHPTAIRFQPMTLLHDGNVILSAFDYPYYNYRLFRSTDPTLTNFEEVLFSGYMKPYSKHSVAQGKDGTILFGEYIGSYAWNEPDANTECKVWKSDDNGLTWNVLYAFRRNNHPNHLNDELLGNGIQHIHVVEYDKYTDSFWIGTGDSDRESSMWRWNKGEGFVLVGRGYGDGYEIDDGQFWRAIAIEFYHDRVMWGVDGYMGGTWVISYDRETGGFVKTTETRTDGYMFYSGTLTLPGNVDVSFFSGTSGTIYYSWDKKKLHILKEFEGSTRVIYTEDVFGKQMLFNGSKEIDLDGQPLATGSITFEPRVIPLKFLGQ